MSADIDSLIHKPFSIAKKSDLPFLIDLEDECFEEYRRSSKDMIRHSIISNNQFVFLVDNDDGNPCGSITLRKYKKQLRIISLAVLNSEQGKNFGKSLLIKAIKCGQSLEFKKLTLEIDANNNHLIRWYETFGFEQTKVLGDYYNPKKHAIKMELLLQDINK